MKITKIVPQRFKKEYVMVFVDELLPTSPSSPFSNGKEPTRGIRIHKEIAAQNHLEDGMEIPTEKLAQIQQESEKKEALEYALLFLSYRSRSEKEMAERLRKKKFSPATIATTLEELKNQKLLNDFEFARNLIESRARNKHYGNYRIRQELQQKGIDSEMAEAITKQLTNETSEEFPSEEERAYQLLEKRAAQMRNLDSHTAYRRLHSFLLRRGFSYDTVEKVLNRFRKKV